MIDLVKYHERFLSKKYAKPSALIIVGIFFGEWLIFISFFILLGIISQIIDFGSKETPEIIKSFLNSYAFILLIIFILFIIRYWLFKVIYSIYKKKSDIKFKYVLINVFIGEILVGAFYNTIGGSGFLNNILQYNLTVTNIFSDPEVLSLFFIFVVPTFIGIPAYYIAGKKVDKVKI